MKSKAMIVLALFAMMAFASNAAADWSDNFDSYAAGSGIIGQGGWEGWDGGIASDAYVDNARSHSAPNSLRIVPTTDVIQQFSGYTSGQWVMSAWQYIPGTSTGEQYFIMLDVYAHGGPNHWAVQVLFANGLVESQFDYVSLPLHYDAWVEWRVEIDLDADILAMYYDGNLLVEKPWTAGSSNDYTGILNIACLDLFSNGGSDIYWDDIVLQPVVTATEQTSWSQVKSLF